MHHAYVFLGSLSALGALADDARKRFGFAAYNDPDVQVQEFEKFGIEESRALVESAALKTSSGRGLYVVAISSITTEAQQALLKLLEEPQEGTTFVLLVPHGALLPTVLSRLMAYPKGFQGSPLESVGAQRFLAAAGKVRSDMIAALLKDDEGTKERVRDFVNELEVLLSKKMQDAAVRDGLADIARVRDYLRDRSPSLKMLLEHLAISLPTV